MEQEWEREVELGWITRNVSKETQWNKTKETQSDQKPELKTSTTSLIRPSYGAHREQAVKNRTLGTISQLRLLIVFPLTDNTPTTPTPAGTFHLPVRPSTITTQPNAIPVPHPASGLLRGAVVVKGRVVEPDRKVYYRR
jgi:hypothetical protein